MKRCANTAFTCLIVSSHARRFIHLRARDTFTQWRLQRILRGRTVSASLTPRVEHSSGFLAKTHTCQSYTTLLTTSRNWRLIRSRENRSACLFTEKGLHEHFRINQSSFPEAWARRRTSCWAGTEQCARLSARPAME